LSLPNETVDIATGAAAAGGFIGACWAAWRKFGPSKSPKKGESMSDVLQRVRALEQRADEADQREKQDRLELRETIQLLFKKADKTQTDVAEIKGMLNVRKGQR